MTRPFFPKDRRIHFVGIGGVGMSGIAEVLLNLGYRVSGSDLKATETTRRLIALKGAVRLGHKAANVRGAQVVVTSSALSLDNPEVAEARRLGIPVIPRAEMLAEIARLKRTITIAGSHGKTTTTSLVAMAMAAAGGDPTMIVGGQLKNIGSNARLGLGEYLVAEADESDGSFLRLSPQVAIVTNIDDDHLDYYGTFANLRRAFLQHLEKVPFYGAAILCVDDPVTAALSKELGRPQITYGIRRKADWTVAGLKQSAAGSRFQAVFQGRKEGEVRLRVPGEHNVLNALAALACGHFLGFDFGQLAAGLGEFTGVGRRLERLGEAAGVTFIDDYGHHPTEIRTTLKALTDNFKHKRLIAIFQPHRYSRTKLLAKKFGPALKAADLVYVTDIYPAGEAPMPGISSKLILDSLKKARVACAPLERTVDVARDLRPGDLVLTIGAGDVWKIGEDLKRRLAHKSLTPV